MKLVACLTSLIALGFSSCQMGPSSASQAKTPAHLPATTKEYKDELERQLGPPWYRLAEINADSLSVGTVIVKFEIPAAGGRARKLRVISNTGGRMNEQIARSAIETLRAPPAPPAVSQKLRQNYFTMDVTFTVFDDSKPTASPVHSKKR